MVQFNNILAIYSQIVHKVFTAVIIIELIEPLFIRYSNSWRDNVCENLTLHGVEMNRLLDSDALQPQKLSFLLFGGNIIYFDHFSVNDCYYRELFARRSVTDPNTGGGHQVVHSVTGDLDFEEKQSVRELRKIVVEGLATKLKHNILA